MRNHHVVLGYGLAAGLLVGCGDGTGPSGPSGPPVVTAINGATQPTGPVGSTVIIEGENFGAQQGSAVVLFSDDAGGTVQAAIAGPQNWSDAFIVTTVPAGAATGDVIVRTSLGSSPPINFTITQNTAFSPSTIAWTATNSLPTALSGHALVFAELRGSSTTRSLYAVGGADNSNSPSSAVYYATVGGSGTASGWATTTPLPAGVAFEAAVIATPANSRITGTGHLYVVGGSSDVDGTPTATVYQGVLAEDGTVTAWTSGTALPVALHSLTAVIFHGDLYVAGGATTGNAPVAAVYRARIGEDGTLGSWQTQPSLPFPRAHFALASFGGYLYAFGGDSGVVAPNSGALTNSRIADVVYAQIDLRTGDLVGPAWTANPSKLTKAVSHHSAVVAGGYVLATAGLYAGASTGSTEQSYSQFNSDGSLGSFNGATGSNTISSLGGGNLFNHAATGYTDGNGVFHVLITGGDDVNAPGTKHSGVYFY